MDKNEIKEGIRELLELRDEVVEKLYEMRSIIRQIDDRGGMITERATSYWIPNTITNLIEDHEWMSRGSMINFDDTIRDLKEMIGEEMTEAEESGEKSYEDTLNDERELDDQGSRSSRRR